MKWLTICITLVSLALLLGCGPAEREEGVTLRSAEAAEAPENVSQVPPESCPVTRLSSAERFQPPEPYAKSGPHSNSFWYGSEALWTAVPNDGVWAALPHNPTGYTQKIFWWTEEYSVQTEPNPPLEVTGRRLDGAGETFTVNDATHAIAADIQTAMLVGVDFPTTGCWEITGRYHKSELSFVVWVAP